MDGMTYISIVIWALIWGAVGLAMGRRYDSETAGCLWGGMLGPLGLIIFALTGRGAARCPRCRSLVSRAARRCPQCRQTITPDLVH